MVLTSSSISRDEMKLKDFKLLNTKSNMQENLSNYYGINGTLIIFMCNHCPYVVHLLDHIIDFCEIIKKNQISSIAISSNDIVNYPQDSPDKMNLLTKEKKFPFPYFFDKNQEVAHYYKALCTPEFLLFNKNHELFYHGRYDKSRPNNGIEVTGEDLKKGVDMLNNYSKSKFLQYPSMGCNIKWIKGNEPEYE
tara:strand:- start:24313 stop:24891 length:579 start_codon:yes stop_codon:yes gene_type:complete